MSEWIVFFSPGACSRVTMTALEQAGVDYGARWIDIAKGQTSSPEYLAINPKGKVPALSVSGRIITENPAILQFLSHQFPDAGILPVTDDPVEKAMLLADLCWCSSALHPSVRQTFRPEKWTTSNPEGVREDGLAKMAQESLSIANRVGTGWWHGDSWSIVDAYICWAYTIAERGGFPTSDYPILARYLERAASWPAYQRAVAREADFAK